MEWVSILAVAAFMGLMLIPAWHHWLTRRMLLAGIFLVLSFAGLVEGVLWILGPEKLYVLEPLGMGPASDFRRP